MKFFAEIQIAEVIVSQIVQSLKINSRGSKAVFEADLTT